nr:hypothetical protein [uncultured Methanoregula sp.]
MKSWNNQKPSNNHSSLIPRIKERHNLVFYATLVVIAVLFIIASPAQAATAAASPPSCDPAMDENNPVELSCPAGVPAAGILHEPDADVWRIR